MLLENDKKERRKTSKEKLGDVGTLLTRQIKGRVLGGVD